MFGRSAAPQYKDRSGKLGSMLRADSFVLRILIFAAMSALFFVFIKITERKIPHGIAPDSTYERGVDTAKDTLTNRE